MGAEHASRFLEGKQGFVEQVEDFGRRRGLLDFNNFARLGKGLGRAGNGLSIAGEALGAADDYRKGVPLKIVVPGAMLHGGASLGAGAIGAGIGLLGGPLGMAAGGIIGSYLAEKHLPDRKAMGEWFGKMVE